MSHPDTLKVNTICITNKLGLTPPPQYRERNFVGGAVGAVGHLVTILVLCDIPGMSH
jgi:hypothetical protein